MFLNAASKGEGGYTLDPLIYLQRLYRRRRGSLTAVGPLTQPAHGTCFDGIRIGQV